MNIEHQYIELMKEILEIGSVKEDRTGTGTISVFGRQLRHSMKEGFPLLTTKKVPLRTVSTELIWFLQGRTDLRWLLARNCHIWTGDAYKKYKNYAANLEEPDWDVHVDDPVQNCTRIMNVNEFENEILMNDSFSERWGNLGPIYGKQWRNFGGDDQVANLVDGIKQNPDSRRHLLSSWNPGELELMTLPPCHYGFQVYTRKLTFSEKRDILFSNHPLDSMPEGSGSKPMLSLCDEYNIPTRAISLMWNQRSVDTPLGLPFNISSYALLLEIIAKEVNMVPDELICNLGDTHIYSNQVEGAKEQIERAPYNPPKLKFSEEFNRLIESDIPFEEKIESLKEEMFKVEEYQHHPKINYPLSN
jgi:thymidylate synthase